MAQIGTKLRIATGPLGHKSIMHWCPGCDGAHGIRIERPDDSPKWQFNGDYDRPTFSPSIRFYSPAHKNKNGEDIPEKTLCHYFIREGRIEFCGDSPHKLAGQTVDIPNWPYAPGTYGGIDEEQT